MDGVEEVIRIRIIKFDKQGRAHWSGMYGQPHSGAWVFPIPDLEVGNDLAARRFVDRYPRWRLALVDFRV